jgi:hypothetical protein
VGPAEFTPLVLFVLGDSAYRAVLEAVSLADVGDARASHDDLAD